MSRLPALSGKEVIRALAKVGFNQVRQAGSHIVLQKQNPGSTITVVVPKLKPMRKQTVSSHPEVPKWHIAHIQEGLRQADAGKFAKKSEMSSAFARWRKAGKKST